MFRARAGRLFAVPFAVLGLVALGFLARGKRPPKTPDNLLVHLAEEGIPAELGEPWHIEEVGETQWALAAAGRSFTLRKMQSVVAAMSEYKAMSGGAPVPSPNPYFTGASEIYRNELYLLELQGKGDEGTAATGRAFEEW